MDAERFQRLSELFERARLADPPERDALLARTKGEDPGLLADLQALLEAHARDDALSDGPTAGPGRGDASLPRAGDAFGPFLLGERLGEGGMGTVFLATSADGDRVALKIIHPDPDGAGAASERLVREARFGVRIRHPNLVATLGVGEASFRGRVYHYLAMEYVEGRTLRELLAELDRVPEELCRHIGRELSGALRAVHEAGAIHRDVKPENVMITRGHVVRLMDLGVACEVGAGDAPTVFAGTPRYAAPEQLAGEPLDARTDLHAVGLLLYELATGRQPFKADTRAATIQRVLDLVPPRLGEVDPDLSPFLEEVVLRLLGKRPEDRIGSAADLVRILEEGESGTWWRERLAARSDRPLIALRRLRVPRATEVLGREEEIARIAAALDDARAGAGRMLLVTGEPGIGKSRLVVEAFTRAHRAGTPFQLVFGAWAPGGAATAAGAFAEALRAHFGESFADEAVRGLLHDAPTLVPAFTALLRGVPPPAGVPPLDRGTLATAFVLSLRRLAGDLPLAVLVEDLHLAPEEGRALFAAVAHAVAGRRILLVGTSRPGLPADWTAQILEPAHSLHLPLRRLAAADLERLVAAALPPGAAAATLGPKIADRSGGNPFFALEMLRRGREVDGAPPGTADGPPAGARVITTPDSVRGLIAVRLAGLDDDDRELLDVAACCGFDFDAGLVAEVLGEPAVVVLRRLARIQRRLQLVRPAGDRFVFDHHQVQEVLYEELPGPLRREQHAAIAAALEARNDAGAGGARAAEICSHYLRGGRAAAARPHLAGAIDHLDAVHAHEAAEEMIGAVLAEAEHLPPRERIELGLRRAALLSVSGRWDEGRRALVGARDEAASAGEERLRLRARLALAENAGDRAEYEEAAREFEELVREARAAGDREVECGALLGLSATPREHGRIGDAIPWAEDAVRVATGIGDAALRSKALAELALRLEIAGRYEAAVGHAKRALALARESGDRAAVARTADRLGSIVLHLGRPDDAERLALEAATEARAAGRRRLQARARSTRGRVLARLLRFEASRAEIEAALALYSELGDVRAQVVLSGWLGDVLRNLGERDEALLLLRRADERAVALGDPIVLLQNLAILGALLFDLGRFAECRDVARRSLALAVECGRIVNEVIAREWIAEAALALGDLQSARAEVEVALPLARDADYGFGEDHMEVLLARIEFESGDAAAAAERCARVLRRGEEHRREDTLLKGRLLAGEIALARGDLEEVWTHAEAYEALVADAGADPMRLHSALLRARAADPGSAARAKWLQEARRIHERGASELDVFGRMRAAVHLYDLTAEPCFAAEARACLEEVLAAAPVEQKEIMLRSVALYRRIAEEISGPERGRGRR